MVELVYMFISLVLSIHIYYMGRWQLGKYVCLSLHVYLTGSQYTFLLYGKMAIR